MPIQNSAKRIILGILIVLTLGLVFAAATHHWLGQGGRAVAASQSTASQSRGDERKPIFWYDAMNP